MLILFGVLIVSLIAFYVDWAVVRADWAVVRAVVSSWFIDKWKS